MSGENTEKKVRKAVNDILGFSAPELQEEKLVIKILDLLEADKGPFKTYEQLKGKEKIQADAQALAFFLKSYSIEEERIQGKDDIEGAARADARLLLSAIEKEYPRLHEILEYLKGETYYTEQEDGSNVEHISMEPEDD